MTSSVICLVVILCCVGANAAPQSPYQPYQPFQPLISFFQNLPRPVFNPFIRPQVAQPPSIETVPVQPPPAQYAPQLVQTQSPQAVEMPIRQNGWFWQNWAALPLWNIPQYGQDGPTIIIVSKPPKSPENSNSNQAVSQTPTTSAPTTEAPTPTTSTESATNMPEIGLTVMNQPVPLAPINDTSKPNVKVQ